MICIIELFSETVYSTIKIL